MHSVLHSEGSTGETPATMSSLKSKKLTLLEDTGAIVNSGTKVVIKRIHICAPYAIPLK